MQNSRERYSFNFTLFVTKPGRPRESPRPRPEQKQRTRASRSGPGTGLLSHGPPSPPHHRRERSGVQQPPSLDAPRGVRRTSHGARRAQCSARRLARALRPAGRLPAPSAVAALCLRQFRPAEHCLTLPRGEKEERKLPAISFHT